MRVRRRRGPQLPLNWRENRQGLGPERRYAIPSVGSDGRRLSGEHVSKTPRVTLEADIAGAFGLGVPSSSLVLAASGWGGHNTVSRLVTSTGVWAVKRHGWQEVPDASRAVRIELAAYVGGVPMARPVPATDGQCWREIGGQAYRCHEWLQGEAKQNETTSAVDALAMGAVVARLHGLRIPCLPPHSSIGTNGRSWEDLARAGLSRDAPWATRLRDAARMFQALDSQPTPAVVGAGELVGGHGDLNAHNVLFSPDGLRLIDWDAAGPVWPPWERASYPVLWAQRDHGRYDAEAVLAFLRGYLDGGGTVEADDPSALGCASAALAPWVRQNIELALDRPSDKQDLLTGLLIGALQAMPRTTEVRQQLLAGCLVRL